MDFIWRAGKQKIADVQKDDGDVEHKRKHLYQDNILLRDLHVHRMTVPLKDT